MHVGLLQLGYLPKCELIGDNLLSKLMNRPEEELSAGRAWVDEVMDNLPDSTMKLLAVSFQSLVEPS